MDWVDRITAILTGLAVIIPLVVQLVKYVKLAVSERNWSQVLDLVMELMKTAETKFSTGAERKEWVLMMLKASADRINYTINYEAISAMIDSLCDMSKVINPPAEKAVEQ